MRVLMVEGSTAITTAQRGLLAAEDYRVDVVPDGAQALRSAREKTYDVLVLELNLPGSNAYRLCDQLRAGQVWTPVLLLEVADDDLGRYDAFDLRADDYLTLPMEFVQGIARLRTLLRRTPVPRPLVLRAGDLTLDPFHRTVERAGTRLSLTAREFELLHFLLRHRGNVLTKEQILEDVWDIHWNGRPNIIEVYVSYLRKKIDRPFDYGLIETVRGVGYRLSDSGPGRAVHTEDEAAGSEDDPA
jgi:two-component system OmpR family response regulator